MNRRLYALHRWISGLALLQLAVWVTTGLFFSIAPIGSVRGAHVEGANTLPLTDVAGVLSPKVVVAILSGTGPPPESLELRASPRGPVYIVKHGMTVYRVDARTAERWAVDEREATEIARRDQPGEPTIAAVAPVLGDPPIEYRDKPLPAWRVRMRDAAATVIYVDANTGDVTARRNDLWRVYDFLWSLHIMDYRKRESFNHPLIIIAASMGLLTVLTGTALWATRIVRKARSRAASRHQTSG